MIHYRNNILLSMFYELRKSDSDKMEALKCGLGGEKWQVGGYNNQDDVLDKIKNIKTFVHYKKK